MKSVYAKIWVEMVIKIEINRKYCSKYYNLEYHRNG